jgi:hypothetical protein
MPADNYGVPQTDGQTLGAAGDEHYDTSWLAVRCWSALGLRPGVPWQMGAELERLRAAFPGFSFVICQGWRGPAFEAWRDPHPGDGLYAVITRDATELWRELEGCRPRR